MRVVVLKWCFSQNIKFSIFKLSLNNTTIICVKSQSSFSMNAEWISVGFFLSKISVGWCCNIHVWSKIGHYSLIILHYQSIELSKFVSSGLDQICDGPANKCHKTKEKRKGILSKQWCNVSLAFIFSQIKQNHHIMISPKPKY